LGGKITVIKRPRPRGEEWESKNEMVTVIGDTSLQPMQFFVREKAKGGERKEIMIYARRGKQILKSTEGKKSNQKGPLTTEFAETREYGRRIRGVHTTTCVGRGRE